MTTEIKQHTVKVDNYMGTSYRKDYSLTKGATVAVIAGEITVVPNTNDLVVTIAGQPGTYSVGSLVWMAERGECGLSLVA